LIHLNAFHRHWSFSVKHLFTIKVKVKVAMLLLHEHFLLWIIE